MPTRTSTVACGGVVIACFILGAPSGTGAGETTVEKEDGTASHPLRIEVRPGNVYCGSLVTVSLPAPLRRAKGATILWTASHGRLFYDDLPVIHWRAPAVPKRCLLGVVRTADGTTARTQLTVNVRAPGTDGMVWIPAGTFLCGDVEGTRNPREVKTVQNANDEPSHRVYLDGYWIDRFPVTNKKFVAFLEAALEQSMLRTEKVAVMGEFKGSRVPFYYFQPYDQLIPDYYASRNARRPKFLHVITWDGTRFRIRKGHEDHPVVDVTWFGAAAYANFYGKNLPTDAQWEKAARGTDGRRYPWGNHLPTGRHVNLRLEPTPVGTYSPLGDSPYGVADIAAAYFEWTNDWFRPSYYRDFLAATPHRNPGGTFWGFSHSVRGFPKGLLMRVPSVHRPQPITNRYSWSFEFLLGDSFGHDETTFRTVVSGTRPPRSKRKHDP